MKRWLIPCLGIVLSCDSNSSSKKNSDDIDRRATLELHADKIMVPAYTAFASQAKELVDAATSFCAAPSETGLTEVRSQWTEAVQSWAATETHLFGPVKTLRLEGTIHFWPVREENIVEFINAGVVDAAQVAASGSLVRGLPVIEYVLFGPSTSLNAFVNNSISCQYLISMSTVLKADADTLLQAWTGNETRFRDQFVNAGQSGSMYSRQKQALDVMVNSILQNSLTIESMKLAKPQGKRNKGVPQPQAAEAPYAHLSKELIKINLDSIRRSLQGGSSVEANSIADLIRKDDAELWTELDKAITDASSCMDAIPGALDAAVTELPDAVDTCFKQVKTISVLLSVDVAGKLGVTPTFSDNDGD